VHRLDAPFVEFLHSEAVYDVMVVDGPDVHVHHTTPASAAARVAREYPTADGKGHIEYFGGPLISQ
jgi:hypothetical protein